MFNWNLFSLCFYHHINIFCGGGWGLAFKHFVIPNGGTKCYPVIKTYTYVQTISPSTLFNFSYVHVLIKEYIYVFVILFIAQKWNSFAVETISKLTRFYYHIFGGFRINVYFNVMCWNSYEKRIFSSVQTYDSLAGWLSGWDAGTEWGIFKIVLLIMIEFCIS